MPNGQAVLLVTVLLFANIGIGVGKFWNQAVAGLLLGICTGVLFAQILRMGRHLLRRR